MNRVPDGEITILSPTEEYSFIVGNSLLYPMFTCVALLLLIVLCKRDHKNNNNTQPKEERIAAICAIGSILCSLLCNLVAIFIVSDFYIPWDFALFNYHFADIGDVLANIPWTLGKIFFYSGFTFHVLSYFSYSYDIDDYDNNQMSQSHSHSHSQRQRRIIINRSKNEDKHREREGGKILFLKIWMCLANTAFVVLMTIYVTDDILEHHMKEIGRLPIHRIYISMYLSHSGAKYTHIAISIIIAVDMLYFGVLLYFYIKQLLLASSLLSLPHESQQNRTQNNNNSLQRISRRIAFLEFSAVRGLILVLFACFGLWLLSISIAAQLSLAWCFGPLDIISDDISLFLMFEFNTSIYLRMCGSCHRTVSNVCFNGRGYSYPPDANGMQHLENQELKLRHSQAHNAHNNNEDSSGSDMSHRDIQVEYQI